MRVFHKLKHEIKHFWQRAITGVTSADAWDVDVAYAIWLEKIYKLYLKDSQVDLTCHLIEIFGEEQTQEYWINKLLELVKDWDIDDHDRMATVHEIHGKLLPHMWW